MKESELEFYIIIIKDRKMEISQQWYRDTLQKKPTCPLLWLGRFIFNMDVSENNGYPQIIHFNRVFHFTGRIRFRFPSPVGKPQAKAEGTRAAEFGCLE